MCGSPTYPSGEHDRALVSRRCRSAGAYAGTGLSAQGFAVPSRNLVIRTLWEFLIEKSVELFLGGSSYRRR